MNSALQPIPGIPWYHIDDPHSAALDEVARRFHLHPLQIEACRHRPQRAKTEEHDGYIFLVLKHLHYGKELAFDDFDVFIGRDFILTVSDGEVPFQQKVQERLKQDQVQRVDKIFYYLLDELVDAYLPVLDDIAEETG